MLLLLFETNLIMFNVLLKKYKLYKKEQEPYQRYKIYSYLLN